MSQPCHIIIALFCIGLSVHLTGQSPDIRVTKLTTTHDGSDQALLLSSEQQDIDRWLISKPDHIDTYAAPADLLFSDKNDDGVAVSELHFPEAQAWQILIDVTALPEGITLQCFNKEQTVMYWTQDFDLLDNQQHILTPEIRASNCVLLASWTNIDEVASVSLPVRIFITPKQIARSGGLSPGFGSSLSCEHNVACPAGANWQKQARSGVRIRVVFEEGAGWCSGTLVNNTAQDGTPFLLSAEHCQGNNTPLYEMWRFDFLYQADSCANPSTEPDFYSMTGCTLRAKDRDSDVLLLELDNAIPPITNAFFSGWDRTPDYVPDSAILIHHPQADIKKISFETDDTKLHPLELVWTEGYSTPPFSHFKVQFDIGGFEPGSSGGGVFDNANRLIGELHGGIAGCEGENTGYVGAMSYGWDAGQNPSERLDVWLDPMGTGQMTLDGMENPAASGSFTLRIEILDPAGRPMPNVGVAITGDFEDELATDPDGLIEVPLLSRTGSYQIEPTKNTLADNGVSASDLLLIQKHLLTIKPFEESYQILASDATANGQISASDLLLLQKLILGIVQNLPSTPSWIFDPPDSTIENVDNDTLNVRIMGIKIGDVNASADPAQ